MKRKPTKKRYATYAKRNAETVAHIVAAMEPLRVLCTSMGLHMRIVHQGTEINEVAFVNRLRQKAGEVC